MNRDTGLFRRWPDMEPGRVDRRRSCVCLLLLLLDAVGDDETRLKEGRRSRSPFLSALWEREKHERFVGGCKACVVIEVSQLDRGQSSRRRSNRRRRSHQPIGVATQLAAGWRKARCRFDANLAPSLMSLFVSTIDYEFCFPLPPSAPPPRPPPRTPLASQRRERLPERGGPRPTFAGLEPRGLMGGPLWR